MVVPLVVITVRCTPHLSTKENLLSLQKHREGRLGCLPFMGKFYTFNTKTFWKHREVQIRKLFEGSMRDLKQESHKKRNVKLNFVLPWHAYIFLLLILRLLYKYGGMYAQNKIRLFSEIKRIVDYLILPAYTKSYLYTICSSNNSLVRSILHAAV